MRTKTKIHRFMVSLNQAQSEALDSMMKEDLSGTKTGFVEGLIVNEYKRRQEESKRKGRGRPALEKPEEPAEPTLEELDPELAFISNEPDFSHDTPKNIPFMGRMVGKQESEWNKKRDKIVKKRLNQN